MSKHIVTVVRKKPSEQTPILGVEQSAMTGWAERERERDADGCIVTAIITAIEIILVLITCHYS